MTYITITSRPGNIKQIEIWKNERFTFFGREVIVVMQVIFDSQISNDDVYKSTAADSWYRSPEVSNALKTDFLRWRR